MKRHKVVPKDVRLYYIRDVRIVKDTEQKFFMFGNPVACVASTKAAGGRVYKFALSTLNPLDKQKVGKFGFKKEARSIAISRVLTVPDTPRQNVKDIYANGIYVGSGQVTGLSLADVGGYIQATEGFSKSRLLEAVVSNKRLPGRVRKAAKNTLAYFAYIKELDRKFSNISDFHNALDTAALSQADGCVGGNCEDVPEQEF